MIRDALNTLIFWVGAIVEIVRVAFERDDDDDDDWPHAVPV